MEGKQQSLPRLPRQKGFISKQSSFSAELKAPGMDSRLCTSPSPRTVDPSSTPITTLLQPCPRGGPGCGCREGWGHALISGEGRYGGSHPTLAWHHHSSLSPTPDPGLRCSAPRLRWPWLEWVGAADLGERVGLAQFPC